MDIEMNEKKIFCEECGLSAESWKAPVIMKANLINENMIELDWQGFDYIKGAGASKENTSANDSANFEIQFTQNGTTETLAQNPPYYWCIKNYILHGVTVNQNKTILRLSACLDAAQQKAVQGGTATLTVRIVGGVTAHELKVKSTSNGAISESSIGSSGIEADTSIIYPVTYKPYYDKVIKSKTGVTIKGSEHVHLSTVQKAADIIDVMLSAVTPTHLENIRKGVQFSIFGPGEHSYNIPEHRSIYARDDWNRAEGYGGRFSATSAANVERHHTIPAAQRPYASEYRSGYQNECILVHEFGHGVHSPGMTDELKNEIDAIYRVSLKTPESDSNDRTKWQGATAGSTTYMSQNAGEFMATAATIWFDVMRETENWDYFSPVNTREELRRYDTPFYNFLSRMYPETKTLSDTWGSGIPNNYEPAYPTEPAEPAGTWGASVKIKNTAANNPAGSGLCVYTPFNAAPNTIGSNIVELWWDVNTDLMRWYLDPVDSSDTWFRIRKKVTRYYTENAQEDNMVLTPEDNAATTGTFVGLAANDNNNQSQQWRFDRQTDGSYYIVNRADTNMVLTLQNDETKPGTRVILGTVQAASASWQIEK